MRIGLRNGTGGIENMFINVTPLERAYNHFGYVHGKCDSIKKGCFIYIIRDAIQCS